MLNLNQYQNDALETAIYPGRGEFTGLMYLGLGLTGESGEITDHIKKGWRDDGGEILPGRRHELKLELGDCLWYIAILASELGYSLEDIAKANTEKLFSRKRRGTLGGSGDNR